MFYLTGDTHCNLKRIGEIAKRVTAKPGDICCILGDSGMNFNPERMKAWKEWLMKLPFTMFIVQGNHDMRPEQLPDIKLGRWQGGLVWFEPAYPRILYAKNGEVYDFEGKKCMVLGGAYSIDKQIRIERGGLEPGSPWRWFEDEQMNEAERAYAWTKLDALKAEGNRLDYIFSHTVPLDSLPFPKGSGDMFAQIDTSSEVWLQKVYDRLQEEYKGEIPLWYAGHFHVNKKVGDVLILFERACRLGETELMDVGEV